jgi:hypothetical protein
MSSGIKARGELIDISSGGISYLQRISKKENARLVLGRKVRVTLFSGTGRDVVLEGDILAVKEVPGPESDYSVHLRFDMNLETPRVLDIVEQSGKESVVVE